MRLFEKPLIRPFQTRFLRINSLQTVKIFRYLLPLLFLGITASGAEKIEKWIYKSTNLLVDKNVDELGQLFAKGHAAGYTHVLLADAKFSRLAELDGRYFKNVERVKQLASKHQIEIVPALFSVGYSNDLLGRDVNLIEALPVRDLPLVVKNGLAVVDDPNQPKLPGGDFSDPKKWSWKDENVIFENGTARVTDATTNARLVRKLTLTPYRQYHLSVWVKTEDFQGKPEIKVLPGGGKSSLTWDNLKVKRTTDWTEQHIVFNSQDNTAGDLFLGAWAGGKGTLRWRDAKLEEVAFLNLARRPGAPLEIKTTDGKVLQEGTDFEPLRDPLMGMKPWAGEFDVYHQPPVLKTKLPDGTKLRASYYHGATVYDGQAMICPSEPKTVEMLRDQAQRVHKLWGAQGYMMSHDEIRVLNHCAACQARHLTPGQILADNVKTCIGILKQVNPGGRIYVWNDMFDPFHNAVEKNYYLVNGSLLGSWEGLDKDVIIVPWYYEKRAESLKFFAERGHRQVIAGYYDSDPQKVKQWLAAAKGVPGVLGVMYTTWRNHYADLEAYSQAIDEGAR